MKEITAEKILALIVLGNCSGKTIRLKIFNKMIAVVTSQENRSIFFLPCILYLIYF